MNATGNRWSVRRLVFPMALVVALAVTAGAQAQDPPTTPSGNTRQPIVTNQFSTVGGGALQQRRPGLFVRQGIAVHSGSTAFFDGNVVDERSFVGQTVRDVAVTFLDSLNQFLDLINGAFGSGGALSGLTDLLGQFGTAPATTTPTTTEAARVLTPAPSDVVPAP